jgi:hypothetical protein
MRLAGIDTHRPRVAALIALLAAAAIAIWTAPAARAGAGFGFAPGGFKVSVTNEDGTPDTQAGSHPYELTVELAVNTTPYIPNGNEVNNGFLPTGGNVKDTVVDLPPGLVGDPDATPQCSYKDFVTFTGVLKGGACPPDTQVGLAELEFGELKEDPTVYNLVPPRGAPAEFGFTIEGDPVVVIPSVRTGGDYGITSRFTSIPQSYALTRGVLHLWGVPGDPGHDSQRGECWSPGNQESMGSCPFTTIVKPFLSMPTSCTGPLAFNARIDSYEEPGIYQSATTTIPGMTGCDRLNFSPQIVTAPEPAQAASPTGLSVEIQVPQTYNDPKGLAEANLKDTVVTLPAGVTVNPAAADGLVACTEAEIGLEDAAEPACPDASKVGSVEIRTPLLPNPLRGSVYLAQQGNLPGNGANPFGSLLALYLTVKDPQSGTLVKIAGEARPDPLSGQVTSTFENNPELPFDSLKLSFFGGPRAALVNPPTCGTFTTTTEMTPYSGGAPASPSSPIAIVSGPGGAPCASTQGFKPSLTAGTKSNQAGGFTPFTLTYGRSDLDQNLGRIQVKTPVGLLGTLTGVALCGEPQAAQGACGQDSLIGHVTAAVGAGSNPFYVTGQLFLTGSYKGAPFGLSIVVPAVAGPFNLGTVVVRASIGVDPHTAALTVTSDPLPQILQGVPLLVRAVNVTLDREKFVFNPTSCNPLAITGTLTGALGASVGFSERFQATNCAALSFKPKFTVTTSGHTSRANGASLDAKLTYPSGPYSANIAKVKVDLPKQLPSRLTTLQKACPAEVFNTNPANCPAASRVGTAKAMTPILPVQLTGPAFFVSHGGEAFPDLVVLLQGYGVRVDLVGTTFINKAGITSSTFKQVPDVPVSTFELYLPQGKFSALAANGDLCKSKLSMPTSFVAQNGTEIHTSTSIGVSGCGKAKPKSKAKKARKAGRRAHKSNVTGRKA